MGGEICLDENYDSGFPGFPGTRLVINTKAPPLEHPTEYENDNGKCPYSGSTTLSADDEELREPGELPDKLSVLLVDDSSVLRKLFSRLIKNVAPLWTIREAGSGEAALRIVETEQFDIIFMDQYMASVEKQLLGTETVVELRARGVKSRICGLSANDKDSEFIEAGADAFIMKPFPADRCVLTELLMGVLQQNQKESMTISQSVE
jgi:CheY-like chemotaxis protein